MKKHEDQKPEALPITDSSENEATTNSAGTEQPEPAEPIDESWKEIREALGLGENGDILQAIKELKEKPVVKAQPALLAADPVESLPIYAALLLLRQWAVEVGHSQYVRIPADMTVPGGDSYSVRIDEKNEANGDVTKHIIVTLEPSAYQVADAQNQLRHTQDALAIQLKTQKSYRAQAEATEKDPAAHGAAMDGLARVQSAIQDLEAQVAEISERAVAPEPKKWVFDVDLKRFEFVLQEAPVAAS